jgi:23S rRNA pseudouridine1911/1915/1917 synthase
MEGSINPVRNDKTFLMKKFMQEFKSNEFDSKELRSRTKLSNGVKIIYEDDCIIVVDKPSGLPTHMLRSDETGTVVNFLMEHYPKIKGIGTSDLMSGLVHRLDTDTSGIVLAVKDNESFSSLRNQFKEHKVLKEYTLLVHGKYNGPNLISNFIGPDPKSKKKVKVYYEEKKGTRKAITEILNKKYFKEYTLLNVSIETGVRHQIRAHFANLGFPLVGDSLYQNIKGKAKDQLGMDHHFLHASKLGFYHPYTGKWVEFESNLTEELDEILKRSFKR